MFKSLEIRDYIELQDLTNMAVLLGVLKVVFINQFSGITLFEISFSDPQNHLIMTPFFDIEHFPLIIAGD